MQISVVVASKDRPALIDALLTSLVRDIEASDVACEVIVVDDGSSPAYDLGAWPGVTVLRTTGIGPARARNEGARQSTGEIIFFTDDDVAIQPGWLRNGLRYLVEHPEAAGVTGATVSPPYSALYEHSVEDLDGGSFLTCNIAYRRHAFFAVGGFDRLFPHAAHEDRDLAWRVIDEVGPVGFAPAMRVIHPGRPFRLRPWWRRGRLAVDDWLVLQRHPSRKASRRSLRWAPLTGAAHRWRSVATRERVWRSPRSLLRFVLVAGGQLSVSAWMVLTRWRTLIDRDSRPVPGLRFPGLRIAYVGPSPHPDAGGAPGVAGLLLDQLLQRGHSVDVFVVASAEDDDPQGLGDREGLSYVIERSAFRFGRWYSRTRMTKMVSSQVFVARGRRRLARRIRALHRATPYDVIYQFSTVESFGVPRGINVPVIIHPSVHAAGERRWHRAEGRSGLSSDTRVKRTVVDLWLTLRVHRQRKDVRRAHAIFALSEAFAREISADYGISHSRIRVVPNCVDVTAIAPGLGGERVVVVGRIAVRKGLEDVVELARQRPDLPIDVVGNHSLWSDYRDLFTQPGLDNVSMRGHLERDKVFDLISRSGVLLQLSRYEPFGLTVIEALATGTPVVVTPAVGSAENLPAAVARVVAPGDISALAGAIDDLLVTARSEDHRAACRAAASDFAPPAIAERLEAAFYDTLGMPLVTRPDIRDDVADQIVLLA